MRSLLIVLLLGCAGLGGQSAPTVVERLLLTATFRSGFNPTQLVPASNGILFVLDQDSRQLAVVDRDRQVAYTGGTGREREAFFDPVAACAADLSVTVCDRAEDRLIHFDFRLNYLGDTDLESRFGRPFYPDLAAVDPWGAVLLYSSAAGLIAKSDPVTKTLTAFIDLENQADPLRCVTGLAVAASGEIGILLPCRRELRLFNRFGRPAAIYPLTLAAPQFLVPAGPDWVAIDRDGRWQRMGGRGPATGILPVAAGSLRHAAATNDLLYLLTGEEIIVVRLPLAP